MTFSCTESFKASYLRNTRRNSGMCCADDQHQPNAQQRDGDHRKIMASLPPMAKPITNEKISIRRAADRRADDHHIGHLHVGRRRWSYGSPGWTPRTCRCSQRSNPGSGRTCPCAGCAQSRSWTVAQALPASDAEGQRQTGHHHQHDAVLHDDIHAAPGFASGLPDCAVNTG